MQFYCCLNEYREQIKEKTFWGENRGEEKEMTVTIHKSWKKPKLDEVLLLLYLEMYRKYKLCTTPVSLLLPKAKMAFGLFYKV